MDSVQEYKSDTLYNLFVHKPVNSFPSYLWIQIFYGKL